jgi:hypothetical protein
VIDVNGHQLTAPLNVTADVAWLGFANDDIRAQVWSVLPDVLREFGLDANRPHG